MADDRSKKDKEPVSPWLQGVTGVTGVVPPGRRLSPVAEKRPTKWSASGVHGIRPPGKQKVGEGPAAESAEKQEQKKALRDKAARKALEQAKAPPKAPAKGRDGQPVKGPEGFRDPGRPSAGFRPEIFAGLRDPDDFKAFLEIISDFIKTITPGPHAGDSLGELVVQSHAPFEIIVAFTILSALVGKDAKLRKRHTAALERGAKAFFNMARRLNPNVKPPRGLVPETLDAIFYDLPQTAYQVPYAFSSDAFSRMIVLLRNDEDTDITILRFTVALRQRFIESRSLGDHPLRRMFPWSLPDWAPVDEEFGV